MKIPKLNKYEIAILIGISIVILVAYLDLITARSGLLGSINNYTNGDFACACWWSLFKTIVLILFSILPVAYYFLVHKDKSEAIAIFLSSYTMWMFLLSDAFYFWLQGQSIPQTLPWLVNHPIASNIMHILNLNMVTPFILYISITLGLVIVYFSTKLLKRLN